MFEFGRKEVVGEVGEMVIASPAPCMPLYFWNDPEFTRYRDSYFSIYEGIWRHGDFMKFNPDFTSIIYGRSNSTLNWYGVRIGTAEIYRCLEAVRGVLDSLVICYRSGSDADRMMLFVQSDERRNPGLHDRIRSELRSRCSPRHVPDEIVDVAAVPYTLTGKKMEVPVRKLFEGHAVQTVASRESMRDPDVLDAYAAFAAKILADKSKASS
jgi:acetoacetyl-CoA synthetase